MNKKKWFYVLPYTRNKDDLTYLDCYSSLESALLNSSSFGKVYEITLKIDYEKSPEAWTTFIEVENIETEREVTPQEIKQFHSKGLFKRDAYETLGFHLINNNYIVI